MSTQRILDIDGVSPLENRTTAPASMNAGHTSSQVSRSPGYVAHVLGHFGALSGEDGERANVIPGYN